MGSLQAVNCNARRPATIARRSLGVTLVRPRSIRVRPRYSVISEIAIDFVARERVSLSGNAIDRLVGFLLLHTVYTSSLSQSLTTDVYPLTDGRCCPAAVHICLAVAAAINGAVHLFAALIAAIWTSTAVRH